ncbi:XRE family transcriptional regulator [Pseudomonas sp. GD03842]|uniref:helix-turn-helix domain-containing protein n=1 Tax=unclassified Pseudomonas TaxID=196821 RepID=UPI000D35DC50|nr:MULTISPECIES: XRE family transcriptional regulator [unclassified Pseudomonas]MDH0747097.1 XRE family transcriptional regulator [Pseudomonas sp. GD03842]RAU44584.1 XRE family transcriptional regulator [Pseudomonas sp. RIT 409]RAU54980.1 XRE family transcriptional regulator [Pseudomonas sp. RIT 412]
MSIRLKLLRKKMGVTLEALAERSGMTKSYLSKVERGLNTPSIATALKLARALHVNVEALFSEADADPDAYSLVRRDQRQLLGRPEQDAAYAMLARPMSDHNLLPFMLWPPFDFAGTTFKEHRGEEFLFVHEGRVEVDFMSETVILERGDALHFNAQKPHRLRSLGDVQAQLLVVVHSEPDDSATR